FPHPLPLCRGALPHGETRLARGGAPPPRRLPLAIAFSRVQCPRLAGRRAHARGELEIGDRMKILVLPGDGIGKEVTAEAVKVLHAVPEGNNSVELTEAPIGGAGIDAAGDPLPTTTLDLAHKADAILCGAAGIPGDALLPSEGRPEALKSSILRLTHRLAGK